MQNLNLLSFLLVLSLFSGCYAIRGNKDSNVNIAPNGTIINIPTQVKNDYNYVQVVSQIDNKKIIYYPKSETDYTKDLIKESAEYHEKIMVYLKQRFDAQEKDLADLKKPIPNTKKGASNYKRKEKELGEAIKKTKKEMELAESAFQIWNTLEFQPLSSGPPPSESNSINTDPAPARQIEFAKKFTPKDIGFSFDRIVYRGNVYSPGADQSFFAPKLKKGERIIFRNSQTEKVKTYVHE